MDKVWTNLITPGLTVVMFQVGYFDTFRIAEQQQWCEPHKKMCAQFGFVRMIDDVLEHVEPDFAP